MKKFFLMLAAWFVVIVSVIVGSIVYDKLKTSKYDDTAIPYLTQVVPQISTWDPQVVKSLMSEDALASIPDEKLVEVVGLFSRMGALTELDEPRFRDVHSEQGVNGATRTVVEYAVDAVYEQGEAQLTINLLHQDGRYRVQHFNLSSEALTQ